MKTGTDSQRVDPAAIERELAEIWSSMNDLQEGQAITRAAMSNVIIFCRGEDQAAQATERIPLLIDHHPARLLMLVMTEATAEEDICASVSAHCRQIKGDRQLCAEHIELQFKEHNIERVAAILRTLLIADLPTALWWISPEPPALCGQVFNVLARMSNQIIYDSVGWPDPVAGIQAMSKWALGANKVLFNLAWRRLKPWRRILSQTLAPSTVPGALENLAQINVRHGPHALPMVWLLIGWLGSRLGWAVESGRTLGGNHLEWAFRSRRGLVKVDVRRSEQGLPAIEDIDLFWNTHAGSGSAETSGHAGYRQEGHHLRCYPGDSARLPTSIPIGNPRPEQMVAAQLAHRAGDTLFEDALSISQVMGRVIEAGGKF